jgi:hypothetical protein
MRPFRPLAVLLMFALAFAACGEGPVSPADDAAWLNLQVVSGAPYVQMASGAGQITLPFGRDQFSFNARQSADGSVSGKAKFKSSFFDRTFRGDVVCMAWIQVAGTDVLAIGTDFPRPTVPDVAGPYSLMFLIDGGEGANASPDRILPDFPPAEAYPGGVPADAAGSCEAISLPPFVLGFFAEPDNGNIQVKPTSP